MKVFGIISLCLFSLFFCSDKLRFLSEDNLDLMNLSEKFRPPMSAWTFLIHNNDYIYGDQGGLFTCDPKWKMKQPFGESYAVHEMHKLDETRFITKENAYNSKVYDLNTKKLIFSLQIGEGISSYIDLNNYNPGLIAYGTGKGNIMIYNKHDFSLVNQIASKVAQPIDKMLLINNYLYVNHRNGNLFKIDLTTKTVVATLDAYNGSSSDLIRINDDTLARTDQQGYLKIYTNDKAGYTSPQIDRWAPKMFYSKLNNYIITTNSDSKLSVINLEGKEVKSYPFKYGTGNFKYVPEFNMLAFISSGEGIVLLGN